jgi:hypothetical protein
VAELLVVMALTGLVVFMAYAVVDVLGQQYRLNDRQSQSSNELLQDLNTLERDFWEAELVFVLPDGSLAFKSNSREIRYRLENGFALRQLAWPRQSVPDSMFVQGLQAHRVNSIGQQGLVEQLELDLLLDDAPLPQRFKKTYDPVTLRKYR